MAVTDQRQDQWSQGANNIATADRVPPGFYREAVNLDPSVGGDLSLRAGFTRVAEGNEVRGAAAVNGRVVMADLNTLVAFDTRTNSQSQIADLVAGSGPFAAAVLNSQLYISTPLDSLRTDGVTVKPWAIPEPAFNVEVVDGGALPPGNYKVAVTAVGYDGEESSSSVLLVTVPAGKFLRVTTLDNRLLRVYSTVANSETLYFQSVLVGGGYAITDTIDYSARLTTGDLQPMPPVEQLVSYHGVLIGSAGNYVFFTDPMHPHLLHPVKGFFQYGSPVSVLAPTDGGVYIVADKTYFLADVETNQPTQRTVLDMDAVKGSAVTLPDGRASWFTRYGQAFGTPSGSVDLPNRDNYAPVLAESGAAGVVDHGGNQMVVTTMRGVTQANNLATGDFADLEIDDGQ